MELTMPESPSIETQQEQAFAQHRERLSRYVQSLVHNRADAEDLMQEIVLRAHRGINELRKTEALELVRLTAVSGAVSRRQ